MGAGARRRDDGRGADRSAAAPLPHRQHPRQQLPDARPSEPTANYPGIAGAGNLWPGSLVIATRAGWNGDVLGQGSGRSAPVAHPRTRSRRRNALRPAHDCHLPRVRNFQLPGMRSFRVPLTVGRGNRGLRHHDRHSHSGSIPAWAGKPGSCCGSDWEEKVHPRVGGETLDQTLSARRTGGPSPRGRGNRHARSIVLRRSRSIPAWAGKPTIRAPDSMRCQVHPRVGGETAGRVMSCDA